MGTVKENVLYGVTDITYLEGAVVQKAFTDITDDKFKINTTENKVEKKIDDGSAYKYDAGGSVVFEHETVELSLTDIAAIRDTNKVTLLFGSMATPKTVTIDLAGADVADYNIEIAIEGLGVKISTWISFRAGKYFEDILAIA